MPDYDIYVLEEDAISISGGEQLDGVTQGDGSHLDGLTITLNSDAWIPVSISDDDPDFRDNDGNQTLNAPVTLNGETYSDGRVVEAEYGIVVSDGVNSWTLVGFNVRQPGTGLPVFGTVEGLAFIGGPGGFPPVGVPLTVTSSFEGPDFEVAEYATPICMASGTRVAVPGGLRTVEDIAVGDKVVTRDHGVREVLWHGVREVACMAGFAPVRFEVGAIGNDRALTLSQQHKVLVTGWQAELLFGATEVLVPAVHLVNDRSVRLVETGRVRYHHLWLGTHALLSTEGAWTESFYPGAQALKGMVPASRAAFAAMFPEALGAEAQKLGYQALARHEAAVLHLA